MKKRKTILILSIILIAILLCITSTKNQNQQEENYQINYYMNDEKIDKMPKNDRSARFDHAKCDNNASIVWDYNRWGPIIKKLTKGKTKCSLYFKEYESNATDYIIDLAKTDTTNLAYDGTLDNNLRYVGATVNNYIDIGDKDGDGNPILWRIIGVMNNITNLDNGGQQDSLVKIIRAESIGSYSWDSSASGINEGRGINEWSQADLMKLLNPNTVYSGTPAIGGSLYWNRGSGSCYSEKNETNTTCDFTSSGLSEEAKEKIAKVIWNTGTFATVDEQWEATAAYFAERGSHNGKEHCTSNGSDSCNDEVERTTTWDGYIGLMYPSDFGYAVGGEVRETCLGKSMYNYNRESCNKNDWLKPSSYTWTITSLPDSSFSSNVFYLYSSGSVDGTYSFTAKGVQPVAYLKFSTKILPNSKPELEYGSKENPFILE